ncbi:50S ribosomal protein L1 [Candidatus Saccharibacteria bacterium]|nr:50S ribosomal protein L1 [Candidatus Saccharibacteria bacterium]
MVKKKEIVDGANQESNQPATQTAPKAEPEINTAKAGKRSPKALQAVEEKIAKEERKARVVEDRPATPPKTAQKPPRSRLERHSKGYRKAAELIDHSKTYGLAEAIDLVTKTSPVKFDATVELHVRLGIDPKQANQNVRQTVVLPAGTGKTVRVAVFADIDDTAKAKQAGADLAAGEEFIEQLEKGELNFDILIATPAMMPRLGKYARLLGPKGLMPNPRSGTVTANVTKAVTDAKTGRVEYRVDSNGIVHVAIGKVSFGQDKLTQNAQSILDSIKAAKPASLKGTYILSTFVTTTMGPSIPVGSPDV